LYCRLRKACPKGQRNRECDVMWEEPKLSSSIVACDEVVLTVVVCNRNITQEKFLEISW
jgi:hypothetical protein